MSLIGSKAIKIPASVTVNQADSLITVKGPKGELSYSIPTGTTVTIEADAIMVKRKNDAIQTKANHGLCRSLLQNMVTGVSDGFTKKLEMIGTGYRAKKQGNNLSLSAGYSHPVIIEAPEGINLDTETETIIVVSGIDKQMVGEVAAKIRAVRKPEPYKGKGIRYQGEVIRRKAGKATKVGA